jgi:hypothetical protein
MQTSHARRRDSKAGVHRDWSVIYLETLGATGKRITSAKHAGVDYATVYRRRKADPDFEAKESAALDQSLVLAEDELRRRAIEGNEHITYDPKGKIKERKRVYSDLLLLRLLERHDPRWRQKQTLDVTTPKGNPMFGTRAERLAALAAARAASKASLG